MEMVSSLYAFSHPRPRAQDHLCFCVFLFMHASMVLVIRTPSLLHPNSNCLDIPKSNLISATFSYFYGGLYIYIIPLLDVISSGQSDILYSWYFGYFLKKNYGFCKVILLKKKRKKIYGYVFYPSMHVIHPYLGRTVR